MAEITVMRLLLLVVGVSLLLMAGAMTSMMAERQGENTELKYATSGELCPPWFISINGSCVCGDSLEGIVNCDQTNQQVQVLNCYCITYNELEKTVVSGACIYGCFHTSYYSFPKNISGLNQICTEANRVGQLCGGCKNGYALPVYSYDLVCVKCTDQDNNVIKYLAVSLLPLTAFFFIVMTISISVTTAKMNAIVLITQIIASPEQLRILILALKMNSSLTGPGTSQYLWAVLHTLASMFGIWNLDFFRTVYSPFCLHPKATTLDILALNYIAAVYPLFLTVLTYVLVKLYDSNYRVVVWAWKPFRYCLPHFRAQWDIRTSLIDAFATFLVLSSVKVLSSSADILIPTYLYNEHGNRVSSVYLYYDGTIEYFGKEHLPYALLAIGILLACFFTPLILLFLYPCRCFQRMLNRYRLRCVALHTFMDAFQGCYKDGTNGTRDCRYFAGAFLLVRLALIIIYAQTTATSYYVVASVALVIMATTIAFTQPYKTGVFNTLDIALILLLTIGYITATATALRAVNRFHTVAVFVIAVTILILPVYFLAILIYRLFIKTNLLHQFHRKIRTLISCNLGNNSTSEESLPDRLVNAEQYEALLPEPVADCSDSEDDLEERLQ